ncbi:hypothetical protein MYCTH_2303155 [Thermothelomyces thermophilus ATCC 42464]|uniref:Uncharacterized protein n=1 Tax=Thermothelomyces thermophilus (strain ATCC 42464 / BCRC 31852 / DSM 1799) TaxID=573729 RepID=G2QC15_THET4|nr:uncharacterized protein MYCTH_2303155 [Thermothelomyces thermophilus ATCC 42464]AEO57242.1 hypothetical protein MYCTH_2303155 [Thermothelomyces thermophilus ATCC 42464]
MLLCSLLLCWIPRPLLLLFLFLLLRSCCLRRWRHRTKSLAPRRGKFRERHALILSLPVFSAS